MSKYVISVFLCNKTYSAETEILFKKKKKKKEDCGRSKMSTSSSK